MGLGEAVAASLNHDKTIPDRRSYAAIVDYFFIVRKRVERKPMNNRRGELWWFVDSGEECLLAESVGLLGYHMF